MGPGFRVRVRVRCEKERDLICAHGLVEYAVHACLPAPVPHLVVGICRKTVDPLLFLSVICLPVSEGSHNLVAILGRHFEVTQHQVISIHLEQFESFCGPKCRLHLLAIQPASGKESLKC